MRIELAAGAWFLLIATMRRDAIDFWVTRGKSTAGTDAVLAGTSPREQRRRTSLQDWTLRQLARHTTTPVGRLVDLACGVGDFTEKLAPLAAEVVACDICPEFVAEAQRRLAGASAHATAVVSDVRHFTAYADADAVYIGAALMYLEDEDVLAVLGLVRERLRPTGILVIREWCAVNLRRARLNEGRDGQHFSVHRRPGSYVALLERAGFEVLVEAPSWRIYAESLGPVRGLPLRVVGRFWGRASVGFVARPRPARR